MRLGGFDQRGVRRLRITRGERTFQVPGLMMWVGGSMIYLLWITVIFLTWASREEAADREQRHAPAAPAPVEGA